jgi:hypothetical protein
VTLNWNVAVISKGITCVRVEKTFCNTSGLCITRIRIVLAATWRQCGLLSGDLAIYLSETSLNPATWHRTFFCVILEVQLCLVGKHLILASRTSTKIGCTWFYSSLEDLDPRYQQNLRLNVIASVGIQIHIFFFLPRRHNGITTTQLYVGAGTTPRPSPKNSNKDRIQRVGGERKTYRQRTVNVNSTSNDNSHSVSPSIDLPTTAWPRADTTSHQRTSSVAYSSGRTYRPFLVLPIFWEL